MPQTSYAYAVARIRALENKLISRERFERLMDAPSAQGVIKLLAEMEYGADLAIASAGDYEALLDQELSAMYRLIRSITPDSALTDLWMLHYDSHNIKVLLKAKRLKEDPDPLLSQNGTISVEKLKQAVENGEYGDIPVFKEALAGLEEQLSLKMDPQNIDRTMDRAYYQHLADTARAHQNRFLMELFQMQTDLINVRTLLRVKKMEASGDFLKGLLLPGGKLPVSFFEKALEESLEMLSDRLAYSAYATVTTEGIEALQKGGRLTVYERRMDNAILGYVRSKKHDPFGLEGIVGYILAKETEIKGLRLLLVAKTNGLSPEEIRERLRDFYV